MLKKYKHKKVWYLYAPYDKETLDPNVKSTRQYVCVNCLNRQNKLCNPNKFPDDKCRLCGLEQERAIHVLTGCKAVEGLRRKHFGVKKLGQDSSWSIKKVTSFLSEERIGSLEDSQ